MIASLKLSEITRTSEMQPRAAINMEISEDYAEDMKAGAKFPPLVVFHVEDEYILVDGFHRALAAQTAGLKKISCEVLEGTMRDAFLYASGVNSGHGLRRTNEDKRRAVKRLLADPEWAGWSDNKIAEICKVSDKTVSKYRTNTSEIRSMESPASEDTRTFIHPKTGTTSTMKTKNIGKVKEQEQTLQTAPKEESLTEITPPVPPAPVECKEDPAKQNRARMEELAEDLLSLYPAPIKTAVSEIIREHPSYKVKDVFYFGVLALTEQKKK